MHMCVGKTYSSYVIFDLNNRLMMIILSDVKRLKIMTLLNVLVPLYNTL